MSTVIVTDGTVYCCEVCDCQIWRYFHLNQTATYADNLFPLTGLVHVRVYLFLSITTEVQVQNRLTFKTSHTLSHAVITKSSYQMYRMFSFKHI